MGPAGRVRKSHPAAGVTPSPISRGSVEAVAVVARAAAEATRATHQPFAALDLRRVAGRIQAKAGVLAGAIDACLIPAAVAVEAAAAVAEVAVRLVVRNGV